MVRIIMCGCNGKMGRVISDLAAEDTQATIVAGIDFNTEQHYDYPVFASPAGCNVEADVMIDFSSPQKLAERLAMAIERKMPIVFCTTGLSEEEFAQVNEASKKIAILRSANMSLGVNTLLKLAAAAAKVFAAADFDIEIVEKHHNRKVDAPSGTALAIADAMNEVLKNEYTYKYDRSKERKARDKKEIGISAVRGGTIVGEHEVIFAGADEVIEIKHTAYSKAIFGNGALQAAKYLVGKPAGMYRMSDVIG
ncbi:MAG: 4-hydroxy-tetrahydrodipicolinate reductase [Lachnospiraceae bacterium]|nr:4-hydroxy-tetrahydrodipicolinate reductase [Lachnospiraceae bacterium]